MTRSVPVVLAVAAACLWSSCSPGENWQRGGEPERQLVQATVTVDTARVQQLLASGADPNKMAPYEGFDASPWERALHQVRPNRPDTIAIVQAMLKAGANPATAWRGGPSRGGYSHWRTSPMMEAVYAPSPDVARALMQAGLDPSLRETQVALVQAVENGEVEIVHVLVEAGVNVNTRVSGNTPLVAAIEKRNVPLLTYLEDHGAREKP